MRLLLVCALALIVRLGVIAATPHFVPINDSADYDRIALSLAEHGRYPNSQITPGPTAFRAPLFPVALAAADRVFATEPDSARWDVGRILEAVLGVTTVALIYLIAARVWGGGVGLLAAGIAAVYPPLVLVGSSLMSESLYIPLMLAAAWSALLVRDGRRLTGAIVSGVLLGLVVLTRANLIVLVLPVCALEWSGHSWRSLRLPLVTVAATLLTVTPWLIRDAAVFHRAVPLTTEGGYALIGQYNSEAQARRLYPALWTPPLATMSGLRSQLRGLDEAQVSDRFTRLSLDFASDHPAYVGKVLWFNSLRMLDLQGVGFERYIEPTWGYVAWLAEVSVYAFWALALLALGGAMTKAARRAPPWLWAFPVLVFLASIPVIGAARYRIPADPFLIMLAALALRSVVRRAGQRRAWGGRRASPPPTGARANMAAP